MHRITRTIISCFVASMIATLAALIVLGDWRPLVTEAPVFSFVYSLCIALPTTYALPALVKWIGTPGPKLILALSVAMLTFAVVGTLVGAGLLLAIGFLSPRIFWEHYLFMVRITAALAVVCGLGSHFYETLTRQLHSTRLLLREKEIEEERATKLALEARLSALESRVHPHFLFNTLNSVSSLIPVDPVRAERLMGHLAAVLRSSLNSAQHRLVTLEREMELVRDYLDIEKVRFGDRLNVSFAVPAETMELLVPPISVQLLVENSVKHGISQTRDGGQITVFAEVMDDTLRIEVRDDGPGFNLSNVLSGHGLDNLISRMDSLFGPPGRLEVGRRAGVCVVTMVIPINHIRAYAG